MAVLNTGSRMFLNYGEIPEVFHTRLIVEHIERMDYVVATPDLDLFCETLDLSNSDLHPCIAWRGFHPPSTLLLSAPLLP